MGDYACGCDQRFPTFTEARAHMTAAHDWPEPGTCEYVVDSGFCGEKGYAYVGTDFTPYCSKHWQEMQLREEEST